MACCAFDSCGRSVVARGLCPGHYYQRHVAGKALVPLRKQAKPGEPLQWLKAQVLRETSDCIEWPYSRRGGYGKVIVGRDKSASQAHAVALNLVQPWHPPFGPFALHSCDNRSCVNPAHLSWGTNAENMRQMSERGRARNQYTGAM